MTETETDAAKARRKLAAKRFNERIKLVVTTVNALAIGIAGSAILIPAATNATFAFTFDLAVWILGAVTLHFIAQALLGLLRSEE